MKNILHCFRGLLKINNFVKKPGKVEIRRLIFMGENIFNLYLHLNLHFHFIYIDIKEIYLLLYLPVTVSIISIY